MLTRKSRIYAFRFLCILLAFHINLSSFGQAKPSFSASSAQAGPFGLGFYNNETVQDRRTSLDLTPQRAFTFPDNSGLSFDFAFLSGHTNYFGYILRLVRNNTQNIDLLFDKVRLPQGYFRMVVGDRTPFGSFKLDSAQLFNSWNSVRLEFDYAHDRLLVHINKDVFVQTGLHLAAADSFRISFGACPVQQFKTTDVPPMKVRDIRITLGGTELRHWPLDAEKGTVAVETVQGDDAAVMNPLWIRSTHYEWKPLDSLLIDGPASCAFDGRTGELFLIGRDSLSIYTVSSGAGVPCRITRENNRCWRATKVSTIPLTSGSTTSTPMSIWPRFSISRRCGGTPGTVRVTSITGISINSVPRWIARSISSTGMGICCTRILSFGIISLPGAGRGSPFPATGSFPAIWPPPVQLNGAIRYML
jgi:hypothetical protein